jgi:outer membrane protein assembly factor BamD
MRACVRTLLLSALFMCAACTSALPYAGLTASELFEYSRAAYEREEWDEAVTALERLVQGAPGFDQMAEARMLLAQAYLNKGDYITANSEFVRFSSTYPTHELMTEAALGLCRSNARLSPILDRDQRYTLQALSSCQAVMLDYPGTQEATEADSIYGVMVEKLAWKDVSRGEFYFSRGLLDSGLIYFEQALQDFPETAAAPAALLFIYRTYQRLEYEEEATEARQRLLDRYPDSLEAQEIRDVG